MHQIFTNATLFTATDHNTITHGAVWVEGNRIKYAGPGDKIPDTPPDAIHHKR